MRATSRYFPTSPIDWMASLDIINDIAYSYQKVAVMNRINVYEYPSPQHPYDDAPAEPTLAGWFDQDKAARWTDQDHNGHGSRGLGRGGAVWRTAQGRWVFEEWSRWDREEDIYQYITPDQARNWLLRNGVDDAVEEYFGPLEEEVGPGRPEIGGRVQVRLGTELLKEVDNLCTEEGVPRAEIIRRAVEQYVKDQP